MPFVVVGGRRRRTGALATAIYATKQHWDIVVPILECDGGPGAALAIGTIAGLLPALRSARGRLRLTAS